MTLFLTDYGLVHGNQPENAWLCSGIHYVLETQAPDTRVRFNLYHAWRLPGGRGWIVNPSVRHLLAQLGRPTPVRLGRANGVVLQVVIIQQTGDA